MPLGNILADFRNALAQCDNLVANSHRIDAAGASILPPLDQQQITVAAFLNVFIAWESFLEASLAELMIGLPTIGGKAPTRYVSPANLSAARELVVGVMRFFDYGNHDNVRKVVSLYFDQGYPYEPHLKAIFSDLADLKTLRNCSAHIAASTQIALESLALRIFAKPMPGITLYQMLMMNDPRSATGETIFVSYKNKLSLTAQLIAHG